MRLADARLAQFLGWTWRQLYATRLLVDPEPAALGFSLLPALGDERLAPRWDIYVPKFHESHTKCDRLIERLAQEEDVYPEMQLCRLFEYLLTEAIGFRFFIGKQKLHPFLWVKADRIACYMDRALMQSGYYEKMLIRN
jgi:hypothetical protein